MPNSAVSDLGMHCLPMSHEKYARVIWVNYLHARYFLHAFCCSDIFQNQFFEKFFKDDKQFGSRSGLTLCQA